jgi:hypothetical protein
MLRSYKWLNFGSEQVSVFIDVLAIFFRGGITRKSELFRGVFVRAKFVLGIIFSYAAIESRERSLSVRPTCA